MVFPAIVPLVLPEVPNEIHELLQKSRDRPQGDRGVLAAPGSSAASSLQITFGPVLTLQLFLFVALQPQGFALHLGNVLHRRLRINN